MRHVKIAFYLDHLTRDTGCLRVISRQAATAAGDQYAETLEANARQSQEQWGISGDQVPAVALEIVPGDVVVFQHNLKHAAFGGGGRRRMFTINCMVRVPDEQIGLVKQDIAGLARFWAERAYGEKMIATASERRMVHLEQRMANDGHLKELAAKARAEMPEPSRG